MKKLLLALCAIASVQAFADDNLIAYQGGHYVMILNDCSYQFIEKNEGALAWSELDWHNTNYPTALGSDFTNGVSTFVMVDDFGYFYYSHDGMNFQPASLSALDGDKLEHHQINSITNNGSMFYAVGNDGYTAFSQGGENWTQGHPINTGHNLNSVTYGNNKVVAVGGNMHSWYSDDNGVSWKEGSGFKGTHDLNAVIWSGSRFVAVGGGSEIYYSDDGMNWHKADKNNDNHDLNSIAYNGSEFVTVGNNGKIWYSSDGAHWNEKDAGKDRLLSVTWGKDKFVAVGENSTVVYSFDGGNWSSTSLPDAGGKPTDKNISVRYANGQFLIARDRKTYLEPLTSVDGINWKVENVTRVN